MKNVKYSVIIEPQTYEEGKIPRTYEDREDPFLRLVRKSWYEEFQNEFEEKEFFYSGEVNGLNERDLVNPESYSQNDFPPFPIVISSRVQKRNRSLRDRINKGLKDITGGLPELTRFSESERNLFSQMISDYSPATVDVYIARFFESFGENPDSLNCIYFIHPDESPLFIQEGHIKSDKIKGDLERSSPYFRYIHEGDIDLQKIGPLSIPRNMLFGNTLNTEDRFGISKRKRLHLCSSTGFDYMLAEHSISGNRDDNWTENQNTMTTHVAFNERTSKDEFSILFDTYETDDFRAYHRAIGDIQRDKVSIDRLVAGRCLVPLDNPIRIEEKILLVSNKNGNIYLANNSLRGNDKEKVKVGTMPN